MARDSTHHFWRLTLALAFTLIGVNAIAADQVAKPIPHQAGKLTSAAWVSPKKKLKGLRVRLPNPPLSLPSKPQKTFFVKKGNGKRKVSSPKWEIPIEVRLKSKGPYTIVYQKKSTRVVNGKAKFKVQVVKGLNRIQVLFVNVRGQAFKYQAQFKVKGIIEGSGEEPFGFFVAGPFFYSRLVKRTFSAIDDQSYRNYVAGLRIIYRQRLFKSFTDKFPFAFKLFADATVAMGYTVTGDEAGKGIPRWVDLRTTFEFFSWGRMRFEGGIGISHFSPQLTTVQAGDITNHFGVMFSIRLAYPIGPALVFLGTNFQIPASTDSDRTVLVSQPLEAFAALSFRMADGHYLENRWRYYQMETTGRVLSFGTFERKEWYFGPELLWVIAL